MKEKVVDARGLGEGERFFEENKQAISDYAESAGLVFMAGERWSMDASTGRGTYDPGFFARRGFTAAETMWAVCHEIEHFRDWRRDPDGYALLYERMGRGKRRLDLLYHQINDILVNTEVDRRFPAHRETRDYLYRYKLMPQADYTRRPRHLQFVDAILRERMLPDEEAEVIPEVRAELDRLKDIDGEGTDLVGLVSEPSAKAADRFDLVKDYIEPVYERFFYEDVEERKRQERKKGDVPDGDAAEFSIEGGKTGTGKAGMEEVDPLEAEGYFAQEYDKSEQRLPQAFSASEIKEAIAREIERRKQEDKSPDEIARQQFRALHGVSVEEVEDYADRYAKVKDQILPLRAVFERVIATRKEVRRRLRERTDQGVIIDPSLIAQAYIDSRSGIVDSRTQLGIRGEERDENKPLDFEFTLICDVSGSMNENAPGGKSYEQRLCAILITEALDEFEKSLHAQRRESLVDLRVFTEVRGFGAHDEELKAVSNVIDYRTRVAVARRLEAYTGRRTEDYKPLAGIAARMDNTAIARTEGRDLKKTVVLITDGGSDEPALTKEAKARLDLLGVVVKAIQIGEPSAEDVEKFKYVWGDDGLPCKDVSRLTSTMEKLLEALLEDL
ncbi:MAG: vWA domain-containing protein [Syntrophorhabdales bacterium]|jgi:hypothetical protein